MRGWSLVSRSHSLVCPLCEAGELQPIGNHSMCCGRCGEHLGGAILETLQQITALPDALGAHACEECGHPEMRLLPDGVFHCPSCGSEVLSLEYRPTQRTTAVAGKDTTAWSDRGSHVGRRGA